LKVLPDPVQRWVDGKLFVPASAADAHAPSSVMYLTGYELTWMLVMLAGIVVPFMFWSSFARRSIGRFFKEQLPVAWKDNDAAGWRSRRGWSLVALAVILPLAAAVLFDAFGRLSLNANAFAPKWVLVAIVCASLAAVFALVFAQPNRGPFGLLTGANCELRRGQGGALWVGAVAAVATWAVVLLAMPKADGFLHRWSLLGDGARHVPVVFGMGVVAMAMFAVGVTVLGISGGARRTKWILGAVGLTAIPAAIAQTPGVAFRWVFAAVASVAGVYAAMGFDDTERTLGRKEAEDRTAAVPAPAPAAAAATS